MKFYRLKVTESMDGEVRREGYVSKREEAICFFRDKRTAMIFTGPQACGFIGMAAVYYPGWQFDAEEVER